MIEIRHDLAYALGITRCWGAQFGTLRVGFGDNRKKNS
jgi:hypothetical protein